LGTPRLSQRWLFDLNRERTDENHFAQRPGGVGAHKHLFSLQLHNMTMKTPIAHQPEMGIASITGETATNERRTGKIMEIWIADATDGARWAQ
jgi:hypothetical protein